MSRVRCLTLCLAITAIAGLVIAPLPASAGIGFGADRTAEKAQEIRPFWSFDWSALVTVFVPAGRTTTKCGVDIDPDGAPDNSCTSSTLTGPIGILWGTDGGEDDGSDS